MTAAKALLPQSKNAANLLILYFCSLLAERVVGYVPPSLYYLANFWRDQVDEVSEQRVCVCVYMCMCVLVFVLSYMWYACACVLLRICVRMLVRLRAWVCCCVFILLSAFPADFIVGGANHIFSQYYLLCLI